MKLLSVTGSRSDYSLMSRLFGLLASDAGFEHHVLVTGMLLDQNHVDVLEKIRSDRFGFLHEVSTFEGSTDSLAMSIALGKTVIEVSKVLDQVRPDYLILQGDRGEMLAAAIAAAHLNIAIIHLSGGDRSGSIDDSIRNAISKFAHLHLTTCFASSEALVLMGESRARIFEVGEPGLDVLRKLEFLSREELDDQFDLPVGQPYILACQHSVTTDVDGAAAQIDATVGALDASGLVTVFTYPNNDAGSEAIISKLESLRGNPRFRIVKNLGSKRFLSLLKNAAVLVGNSSSGIWEAPSFHVPVVNIGDRQHGRTRAGNVLDVPHDAKSIEHAIQRCLTDTDFLQQVSNVVNPYGDGKSSEKIVELLKTFKRPPDFIVKWLDR